MITVGKLSADNPLGSMLESPRLPEERVASADSAGFMQDVDGEVAEWPKAAVC